MKALGFNCDFGTDVIGKDQQQLIRNALHSLIQLVQLGEFPAAVDVVLFDAGSQLHLWEPQLSACVSLI